MIKLRSLRLRFALWLLPVVLGVTAAVAGGLWVQRAHTLRTDLERGVATVLSSHAPVLAEMVWALDATNVRRLLRAIHNTPDITCVVAVDTWSDRRYAEPNADCLAAIPPSHHRDRALNFEDERVGRVTAGFTDARIATALQDQLLADLAMLLALMTATLLTVWIAFGRTVARPLRRLLRSIQSGPAGRGGAPVEWRSDDELGRVIDAYNGMVRVVDEHATELETTNEALAREKAETERAYAELGATHTALERANHLLRESIHYARRIQDSLLPDASALGDAIADVQIWWEPLDVVGGDYFWFERFDGRCLFVVADCTGHGVPGAFMTLVTASALDRILHQDGLREPQAILEALDARVRSRLRQDCPDVQSDDGLEAVVVLWQPTTRTLTCSAAGLPLIRVRADGGVTSIKGNRAFLGYRSLPPARDLAQHSIALEPGDRVFLFTDGATDHMADQPPHCLFGRRRLETLLTETAERPLSDQLDAVREGLTAWRGGEPVRDDITLIGIMPWADEAKGRTPQETTHSAGP